MKLNKLPNEMLHKIASYATKRSAGRMFNAVNKVYRPLRKTFHGKQYMVHKLLKKPISKARYRTRQKNIWKAGRKFSYQKHPVMFHQGYNSKGKSMLRNVKAGRARHRGVNHTFLRYNRFRRRNPAMRQW